MKIGNLSDFFDVALLGEWFMKFCGGRIFIKVHKLGEDG